MIPQLLYISQATANRPHAENIRRACDAGCRFIQLRVKDETPARWLQLAEEAMAVCERYHAALFINDNPYVAQAVGAKGVHLGLNDMSVAEARKILGDRFIIGGTANTAADIRKHTAEGADYIGLGPYRFTTTKQKLSPVLGLEGYASVLAAAATHLPVLAIGGILEEDIVPLLQTGVHGVAVSGLITHAPNGKTLVAGIVEQFKAFADGTFSHSR